ncbi:unnamed protein product [Onchocerca ochengi]|nr:unnamed protein product [Onchocerca ochengi]
MAIFESNELITEAINRKYKQGLISYTAGLNDMADLTDEEFRLMNGFLPLNETYRARRYAANNYGLFFTYNNSEALPKRVDWRNSGIVTPVKAQGLCGSCYAFASAAALEAYHKRKTGRLVDLSPQNILECTWKFGNKGCRGGFMNPVFVYASTNGISTLKHYPYVGTDKYPCSWRPELVEATDRGYYHIPRGDERALQYAVAKGPVVVGISGYHDSFKNYRSGIYTNHKCKTPNHAVLVVGYGTSRKNEDYWIIKNSWGQSWGRNGFGYLARNKGNMCQIATMASFPR